MSSNSLVLAAPYQVVITLAVLLTSAQAGAQDGWTPGVRVPAPPTGDASTFSTPGVRAELVGIEPVEIGRPVIGVPFSAESIVEFTQTLEDGNRIEQRVVSQVARDSRGRVRREQRGIALGGIVVGGSTITISDGENGVFITLDPGRKLAFRAEMPVARAAFDTGVRPQAATIDPDATTTTRSLAPTQVEGLFAEGTETTLEIPAGAVGNRKPVRVVSERWYSPELQTVLLTKRHDPRFGRTQSRLTNIRRTEPRADLFEIPADFRIERMLGLPAVAVKPLSR